MYLWGLLIVLYKYDDVIVVLIYKRVDSDEGVLIRCGHFITVQYTAHIASRNEGEKRYDQERGFVIT